MRFHPKVTAGALAGALTTVIITELNRRGITIDGSEGASITVILSFLAGYLTSDDGQPVPSPVPAPVPKQPLPPPAPGP